MATTPHPAASKPSHKERFIHEMKDYAGISTYLAVLFCAIAAYTMLLTRRYEDTTSINFTFAILNALVIGKVILIGEMIHLGRHAETRPLYQTVLFKSFLFGLLIFAFHIVEEFVKRVIHHEPAGTVFEQSDLTQLAARSIIVLIALIPLFTFREINRVLGEGRLRALFIQSQHERESSSSGAKTR